MATKNAPNTRVAQPVKRANVQRMFIEEPIIDDLVFGVLRREYKGLTNDARAFVRGKLQPMMPPAAGLGKSTSSAWAVTATRHEVLLPYDASDTLCDPRRLVELYEDEAPPGQKDLVISLKLTASRGTLHAFWNRVRHFACTAIVEEHRLPLIIAMHDSRRSGTREATRPHVHVMALARQLDAFGFGARTTIAITNAQAELAERWEATS